MATTRLIVENVNRRLPHCGVLFAGERAVGPKGQGAHLSLIAIEFAQKPALRSFPDPHSFSEVDKVDNVVERGNTISQVTDNE